MADMNLFNETEEEQRNEVVVTFDGRDVTISLDDLDLTMESTPDEILAATNGIIEEESDTDLTDGYNDFSYTVRKAMNSSTIYVYPKPVAG